MGVYTERIVRGAARLDNECPGWRNQVDLQTLDLTAMSRCVLGQVLGHFTEYKTLGLSWKSTPAYGFRLGLEEVAAYDKTVAAGDMYSDLTREWREYIAATRAVAA